MSLSKRFATYFYPKSKQICVEYIRWYMPIVGKVYSYHHAPSFYVCITKYLPVISNIRLYIVDDVNCINFNKMKYL